MRILSWNIQWGRGADGRVDLARIAAEIRHHDPDVVCLQEVAIHHPGLPGGAAMDQAAVLAGLFLGWEHAYGAASDLPDGLGGRRRFGNMILSRLPLGQVFRHALPFPPDPAVPAMPRMALEATVMVPLGPLRLITTHLEYYSGRQRLAQVEALRRIHAEGSGQAATPHAATDADPPFTVLPRGAGLVVCGDFNAAPDSEAVARLSMPFDAGIAPLRDAWRLLNGENPHPATAGVEKSPYFPQPLCYDFAFVSDDLAPRVRTLTVDGACRASDHQPLLLELSDT